METLNFHIIEVSPESIEEETISIWRWNMIYE
jgi:hypothetical protein